MKRLLLSLLLIAFSVITWSACPPNNEIWYKPGKYTTVAPITSSGFGANLISNVYVDTNRCILTFDAPVTAIPNAAFNNVDFQMIHLPMSVASLGDNVAKSSIYFNSKTAPSITASTFSQLGGALIFVPSIVYANYKTAFSTFPSNEISYSIAPLLDEVEKAEVEGILKATLEFCSEAKLYRTLYCDGYFNTICLPFSLSAAQLASSPLAGYSSLKKFVSATVTNPNTSTEELQIELESVSSIEAGVPYFIAWPAEKEDIVNPLFDGIDISQYQATTIAGAQVSCVGTFVPVAYTANTYDKLFLGEENTLYWASVSNSMKGFRAYFTVNTSGSAPMRAGMPARLVNAPAATDTATNIENTEGKEQSAKLLRDGRLLIVRDGRTYNAQGLLIE